MASIEYGEDMGITKNSELRGKEATLHFGPFKPEALKKTQTLSLHPNAKPHMGVAGNHRGPLACLSPKRSWITCRKDLGFYPEDRLLTYQLSLVIIPPNAQQKALTPHC